MNRQSGFTLIELSIVIMIMGVLLAGFLKLMSVQIMEQKQEVMALTYDTVQEGLRAFIFTDPDPTDLDDTDTHGRYPCPASPIASPDSADYGTELRNEAGQCVAESGVIVVPGTDSRPVYIGSLPFRTMQISSSHAIDVHGNRLSYAVSGDLALENALLESSPVGAITLQRASGPDDDRVHFAIVSHGDDGAGSYTKQGVLNGISCQTGKTADSENCDGDSVFAELDRALGLSEQFYDDKIAFTLTSEKLDQPWANIDNNPNAVKNTNPGGLVWIGPEPDTAETQEDEVLVTGGHIRSLREIRSDENVVAVENIEAGGNLSGTEVHSESLCNETGKNCVSADQVYAVIQCNLNRKLYSPANESADDNGCIDPTVVEEEETPAPPVWTFVEKKEKLKCKNVGKEKNQSRFVRVCKYQGLYDGEKSAKLYAANKNGPKSKKGITCEHENFEKFKPAEPAECDAPTYTGSKTTKWNKKEKWPN